MSTSLRDTLVRERYLTRFSWALQDHPKDTQIVRELRTELTATAAEVGMRQAVADLGHPRVLADAYLDELGRPVPRWATGAVWGALAVGAVAYLVLAYGIGTLDTIGADGRRHARARLPRCDDHVHQRRRRPVGRLDAHLAGRWCSTRACSRCRSCWARACGAPGRPTPAAVPA